MDHKTHVNYLSEIIKMVKQGAINVNTSPYNIIFLLKDFISEDTIPTDKMAPKYGVLPGETVKLGTAPRLAYARTEMYWLKVTIPYMLQALKSEGIKFPIRILLANPDSVIGRRLNECYLKDPVLLSPKSDVVENVKFMHDFAINGEEEDRKDDFIFRANRFFNIQSFKGFLPVDHRSLVVTVSTSSDSQKKMNMAVALQKAENSGALVVEKPRFWVPDYIFQTFGHADPKAFARSLMPEYYPPSCEGRVLFEAMQFFKRHQHIVLKPSNGANGFGVAFFDIKGLNGEEKARELKRFEMTFNSYLEKYIAPIRLIVQPYLENINQDGEVRVFIYKNKILPVGIRLIPKGKDAVCKIFLNAKVEAFLLDPELIRVAVEFIEKSRHMGLNYFGLDIIKDKGPDGQPKYFITEANFMISGFFDKIAYKMDTCHDEVQDHIDALPENLQKYVSRSHMNDTVYRLFYEFLRKNEIRRAVEATHHSIENGFLASYVNRELR
ncbi:MAG: hypothetical protein AAF621_03020 [Pseudomonadota bacterium]